MNKHTTEKLTEVLMTVDGSEGLHDYIEKLDEESSFGSFQEYFNSLSQVKNISRADLIKRTNIDRSYGYQILRGTRSPGRDKVILLCIAAGIGLHETQRALRTAGEQILYSRNRRDAILMFVLNEGLNITDTQELLQQFSERVLE